MKRRAWRTVANDVTSITFATSRSKAKYHTFLAAREAGYPVKITEITARRASEFDECPLNHDGGIRCFSVDHAHRANYYGKHAS